MRYRADTSGGACATVARVAAGCALLIGLAAVPAMAAGLQPLDDGALSSVTGQEGVALDFEYGMNANPPDANKYVTPVASLNNCTQINTTTANPCALAISINKRDGMWVVMKDMYGVQRANGLWLDGGKMLDDGAGHLRLETVHDAHLAGPILSNNYPDPSRFYDENNLCMIKPGANGSACNVTGLPTLVMQYNGSYTTFEPDVEWFLNIGRVAVQYDNGSTKGYMTDQTKSFMSYQIGDFRGGINNNRMAEIDYDGRVLMFGF